MKRMLYGVICCLFLVSLAACGGGTDKDTTKDKGTTTNKTEKNAPATNTADAEKTFKQTCAACHGADLKSGYAPDLDKIGSKYKKNEIEDIIHNGQGQMPKQNLSDKDADAVATWLAGKK